MTDERTTRQRLTAMLREADGLTPAELAHQFDDPTVHEKAVVSHLDHIRRSVGDGEQLFVAPPVCRDCGFDDFDHPEQHPSRCPDCRSESLDDPIFTIRDIE